MSISRNVIENTGGLRTPPDTIDVRYQQKNSMDTFIIYFIITNSKIADKKPTIFLKVVIIELAPDNAWLQVSSLQKQSRISTSTDFLPITTWTAWSSLEHPGSKAYWASAHPRNTGAIWNKTKKISSSISTITIFPFANHYGVF